MLRPFILIFIAVCFTVTGELLLKAGMNKLGVLSFQPQLLLAGLVRAFTIPQVILGFGFVFIASIFWLGVLSRVPLSWAYPMLSMSYILGIFGAWAFLGETISWMRILGVFIICSGISVMYRS